jgi:hypothetical protein
MFLEKSSNPNISRYSNQKLLVKEYNMSTIMYNHNRRLTLAQRISTKQFKICVLGFGINDRSYCIIMCDARKGTTY